MPDIRIAEAHDAQDPRDIAALPVPPWLRELVGHAVAHAVGATVDGSRLGEPELRAITNHHGGAHLAAGDYRTDERRYRLALAPTGNTVGHSPGPRTRPRDRS